MATRTSPGKLGDKAYTASGSVDSDLYAPRNGCSSVTIYAVPTTAGDAQPFLRTASGDTSLNAAVSGTANELNSFKINFPAHKLGAIFLRFTDTAAAAGTVSFAASDDA